MKKLNNEFFRFAIVGGVNTLNYYLIFLLLNNVFNFYYMVAHITGIFISMIISYFLNCYFTYGVKPTWRKFFQFPLTQLVNVTVSSSLVFVFVELFSLSSNIAPIAAMFITVPVTFLVTGKILKQNGAQHET
ncbi:GtrA family protein [Alkalicoccobacillus plakortidis]|uniref:GtrA family protein n=1 Tax=Alkalicoccobacillus plakortidis TaxID=444060 RepID=A0ABT0XNX8_9BACI|nr:GtrA family protein [Alkalicoccobacillus plakortidis]MCM2676964.1 GtrA family protein [Alkalicoccobacillus plakortidis]